jgi:hypothetical protein
LRGGMDTFSSQANNVLAMVGDTIGH